MMCSRFALSARLGALKNEGRPTVPILYYSRTARLTRNKARGVPARHYLESP